MKHIKKRVSLNMIKIIEAKKRCLKLTTKTQEDSRRDLKVLKYKNFSLLRTLSSNH